MAPSQSPRGRPWGPPPGLTEVRLEDHGLSQGDDLAPYFNDFIGDGVAVTFPAGNYRLSSMGSLSIDDRDWNAAVYARGGQAVIDNSQGAFVAFAVGNGKLYYGNMSFENRLASEGEVALRAMDSSEVEMNHVHLLDVSQGLSGRTGFFVRIEHESHVTLRNCQAHGASDNGIYASAPGKRHLSNAGNGSVWVLGGLYTNNNVSQVRLGSDNSRAEHVTIAVDDGSEVGPDPRGGCNARGYRIRDQGRNILIRDCHAFYADTGCATMAFEISGNVRGCDGSTTIEDCVFYSASGVSAIVNGCGGYDLTVVDTDLTGPDGEISGSASTSNVCRGSGCRSPRREPLEVLENGSVAGQEPECAGDDDCPEGMRCDNGRCVPIPLDELYDHQLVFRTFEGDPVTLYEFVVRGEAEPDSQTAGESATNLVDNGDGTWTCSGQTGNGFDDTWYYSGIITDFVATDRASGNVVNDGERYMILLDGAETPVEDVIQEPGNITITDIIPTDSPVVGVPTSIIVSAENVGEAGEMAEYDVIVDGGVIGTVAFDLGPGESESKNVGWTPEQAGTATIMVGSMSTTVEVRSGGTPPPTQAGITLGTVVLVGGAAVVVYRSLKGK